MGKLITTITMVQNITREEYEDGLPLEEEYKEMVEEYMKQGIDEDDTYIRTVAVRYEDEVQ